jgi:transposase
MSRKEGTAKQVFEARQLYFKHGWSTERIGQRLGFSRKTIRRWISPMSAEKDRKRARKYYRHNRQTILENKRLQRHQERRLCPLCEQPMGAGSTNAKRCQSCLDSERQFKYEYLTALWNERVPIEVIAERLEWTVPTTYTALCRARQRGYKLAKRNLSAESRAAKQRTQNANA